MSGKRYLTPARDLIAKRPLASAAVVLLVGVLFGVLIQGGNGGGDAQPRKNGAGAVSGAGGAAQATMWTCSMHPQIRSDKPGKCRICGMDLVPVSASAEGIRTLTVSPEARALMHIATSPVERRYVTHDIPMVGKVDYDETKVGYITAWVGGRLDRLYVDYAGVYVNKGDHMAYLYSPELYAAQEELTQALKYRPSRQGQTRLTPSLDMVRDAREKLRLLGLTAAQIQEIERQNAPEDHVTIYSPASGIVIEKLKEVGDYVNTGERIYSIADLNQVWVQLDAYESDLPWVRYGQDVVITTESYPGDEFHGRIALIQPVLNDKTRTVKVRVNAPNPEGKLKPEMFVHAVVRPRVAAGGRVMDPSLVGKWICPMHPEIVKDELNTCDICGMDLVTAESLGFAAPSSDELPPPLVIPYSAALVTGRRAIVYVELPAMPEGLEAAFQGLSAAVAAENLEHIRKAFAGVGGVVDRPYGPPEAGHARELWERYKTRLAALIRQGEQAESKEQATSVFTEIESLMTRLREEFGPAGQPTYEGREIVLGPRAGDYYLVRHGLEEGELVVTEGNFKIDAEIQIQAKPSMMTPEGGGGGGHQHGDAPMKPASGEEQAGHAMALPPSFRNQVGELEAAYRAVAEAVEQDDVGAVTSAFSRFQAALDAVDGGQLAGHARMLWREFAMLLGNDAVEGLDVKAMADAHRVYQSLRRHITRMRDQLGIAPSAPSRVARVAVPPRFQADLAAVWERYLAIQKELAADQFSKAKEAVTSMESAVAAVDSPSLTGRAEEAWDSAKAQLSEAIGRLDQAQDIDAMRAAFKPLSERVGALAKTFGFGEAGPIYELHCPMAFSGQGAVWYQSDEQVRNPYYGAAMLTCADRVERLVRDEPSAPTGGGSGLDHSQH